MPQEIECRKELQDMKKIKLNAVAKAVAAANGGMISTELLETLKKAHAAGLNAEDACAFERILHTDAPFPRRRRRCCWSAGGWVTGRQSRFSSLLMKGW